VLIQDGQRFGLHNLRHSLSNWLVNKAKVEPETVQGILRHSRIQTTLDLYTQEDNDEARGAQGKFLRAVGVSGMGIRPVNTGVASPISSGAFDKLVGRLFLHDLPLLFGGSVYAWSPAHDASYFGGPDST
jgi:Phage integrase family